MPRTRIACPGGHVGFQAAWTNVNVRPLRSKDDVNAGQLL
jgi:hypothetical protein